MAPEELSPRAVLGIDAAWSATQPSGVALAAERDGVWRLLAAAPSYAHFLGTAGPGDRPAASLPDPPALLATAYRLGGAPPALVAIDMPIARLPITGRREADNAVSRVWGGRKCGTHSPSGARPGPLSDTLTAAFAAAGYPLLTTACRPPGLIEVYPHPALVVFTGAAERLPYKRGKSASYWRDSPLAERRCRLAAVWDRIVGALDGRIAGTAVHFAASPFTGKAAEDMLDAVVCCAIAIAALDGRAEPLGDADAAIWIPVS